MAVNNELRSIARRALEHYGMSAAQLQLLKHGTTTTFRVDMPSRRFVLRLQRPGRMPPDVVLSEMDWLQYLQRKTSFPAITPIPAPDGSLMVAVPVSQSNEYCCTMFAWMQGRHKTQLTIRDANRVGKLLGRLHNCAASFDPPSHFRRWDFDLGEFLENADHIATRAESTISATDKAVVHTAVEEVKAGFLAIEGDPTAWGLIHADMNLTNIRWLDGEPQLIDFEVCCFGPYLFDVGRFLHELDSAASGNASALAVAFHTGYTFVRPLPALDSPTVRAFKLMSLIDVVAWLVTMPPELHVLAHDEQLATTLETIRSSM